MRVKLIALVVINAVVIGEESLKESARKSTECSSFFTLEEFSSSECTYRWSSPVDRVNSESESNPSPSQIRVRVKWPIHWSAICSLRKYKVCCNMCKLAVSMNMCTIVHSVSLTSK